MAAPPLASPSGGPPPLAVRRKALLRTRTRGDSHQQAWAFLSLFNELDWACANSCYKRQSITTVENPNEGVIIPSADCFPLLSFGIGDLEDQKVLGAALELPKAVDGLGPGTQIQILRSDLTPIRGNYQIQGLVRDPGYTGAVAPGLGWSSVLRNWGL
jgi:hypothetical protein